MKIAKLSHANDNFDRSLSVGFTGTREQMTTAQLETCLDLLNKLKPTEVHHGDCVGADAQFHELAACYSDARIYAHPAVIEHQRAYCKANVVHGPLATLKRNAQIVKQCSILIACPLTDEEVLRSGTWATIRSAWRTKRALKLILPNGRIVTDLEWLRKAKNEHSK